MFAFCENKNIYIWTGLYVCMSTNVHILKNYLLGHIWTGKNLIRLHIQCNNIKVCLSNNNFIYVISKYPGMMWNDRIILVN